VAYLIEVLEKSGSVAVWDAGVLMGKKWEINCGRKVGQRAIYGLSGHLEIP